MGGKNEKGGEKDPEKRFERAGNEAERGKEFLIVVVNVVQEGLGSQKCEGSKDRFVSRGGRGT